MRDKLYILSIRDFLDEKAGEAYIARAFGYVDAQRKAKAERIKQPEAKAACLGAGLLLQIALQETLGVIAVSPKIYMVSDVLAYLKEPLPLEFSNGMHGKPYLKNYPYYFNLSHSGEYVICALSEHEVGVDIQQHRHGDVLKLAGRFFAEREYEILETYPEGERQSHFFTLWAKKEAYGKLTGEGVSEVLGLELKNLRVAVDFKEYNAIPGYSIVLCKEQRRKV